LNIAIAFIAGSFVFAGTFLPTNFSVYFASSSAAKEKTFARHKVSIHSKIGK